MISRWLSLIEFSLTKLTEVVQQTQREVLIQGDSFTNEATLPMCCQLNKEYLTYDPKFRHDVSVSHGG
jgi:hypothetical protein